MRTDGRPVTTVGERRFVGTLSISRGTGPAHAPTAKPLVGFDSLRPWKYDVPAAAHGTFRVALTELRHRVHVADELSYLVFPVFGNDANAPNSPTNWHSGGYAATGIILDLVFSNGDRLSEQQASDDHGVALSAEAQGASRTLQVDQWNRKSISLAPWAGREVVAIEAVVQAHPSSTPFAGWIDSVIITAGASRIQASPSDWVSTTRGTHSTGTFSRGNTIPATAVPAGFNFIAPVTNASDPNWPYSFHRDNDEANQPGLQAFAICHSPTPWLGDHGVLHLMPVTGFGTPNADRQARQLTFQRKNEEAKPHLYTIAFDNGVTAKLAPTMHSVFATFTFPEQDARVLFDQVDDNGAIDFSEAHGPRPRVSGFTDFHAPLASTATRTYFVVEFDHSTIDFGPLEADGRKHVAGYVSFVLGDERTVNARIATSFIGVEQALRSMQQEIRETDTIASVTARAHNEWDELLGAFEIDGATPDQLTSFYSCLYRLFLYPNIAHENVGTTDDPRFAYASVFQPPAGRHGPAHTGAVISDGTVSVNNGFWDTYRTAWPAYALFAPDRAAMLLEGFVRHYQDGGWMARWSAPGYVDCMVGTSSDVVLADAVVKGVPIGDPLTAYDSALKNACVPSEDPSVGRKGLSEGIFRGYISTDVNEGMSWSLENAVNDFGLATFSDWLGETLGSSYPRSAEFASNARYFKSRALEYTSLFDRATGFFQGRAPDGKFRCSAEVYDPRVWGGDYTETNGWGMAFTVPHDGNGLASLLGGPDQLEAKLDEFFITPERGRAETQGTYGTIIHEMTEARDIRMGMLGLSNQPAHHIPYMYAFTNAPHKTQAITRDALRRLFLGSEIGQGYPGDEDNGEMSAWYIFSALGFYPLTVGSPWYAITSPLFGRVSVALGHGRQLTIDALNNSAANIYIQRMMVDGKQWDAPFIDHSTLARGCHIEMELGPEPSRWGQSRPDGISLSEPGVAPRPYRDATDAVVTASFSNCETLIDNSSSASVTLPKDAMFMWRLARPESSELYTLTSGDSAEHAPSAWRLEASDDAEKWTLIDVRTAETFRWPRQTRPFLIRNSRRSLFYRLVSRDNDNRQLSQVELLV